MLAVADKMSEPLSSHVLNEPSVCIVLINWNQLNLTLDCLDSLKRIHYTNFKVVVVDNNSKEDPTKQIKASFPDTVVLRQMENLGFAEGNNVGFRYAYEHDFELVLALNNDTIVSESFLKILVDALRDNNKNYTAISPKIYFKHDPKMIWALGGKVSIAKAKGYSYQRKVMDKGQFEKDIKPDYLTGCCLLIKADVLKAFEGFNKDYFAYYEDTDLSYRLTRAGHQLGIVQESVIWHVAGGSSRPNKRKPPFLTYLGTRNRLMFFRTNMSGFKKIYTVSYIGLDTFTSFIFLMLTLQLRHAKELLRGLLDGLKYQTNRGSR
ncbi:MAG: GT2 family glycosyltransferase [Marinoscillum sp.]